MGQWFPVWSCLMWAVAGRLRSPSSIEITDEYLPTLPAITTIIKGSSYVYSSTVY